MITAIVTQQGKDIPTVIQQELKILTEEHTKLLAEEHKKELDKAIDETRTRVIKQVGNHLKDQIQVEKIFVDNTTGYGVGNIEVLNQKAKWWAWINFGRAFSGRTIPPGTKDNIRIKGHFEPASKGIFVKGSPRLPIDPKKPILPHNYIERALSTMISKIRTLLK